MCWSVRVGCALLGVTWTVALCVGGAPWTWLLKGGVFCYKVDYP
ncbi:hypothetical protein [Bartonella sp. CM120XJJH]